MGKRAVKSAKRVKLGKVVSCQIKEDDEIILTSSKIERNVKPNGKLKSDKVLKQISFNGQTDTSAVEWNFEDEYKSYVHKSMKRILRSSDASQPQKLLKIHQGGSALQDVSVAHDVSTNKLKTMPTDLERDLSGKFKGVWMNGHVVLEKLSSCTINSHIRMNDCESIESKNTRARSSIKTRSNRMDNNAKSMELQLASEPRVALDQTIVNKYLTARKKINDILKPEE